MSALTSREVCEQTGVTYRQLDYWCRRGLVRPTVEASGQGSRRGWARADVERVRRVSAAAAAKRRPLAELVG